MEGIVEMHNHKIARQGTSDGWYCTHVYLDGVQCQTVWKWYPGNPGDGSRVFRRDSVRAWLKAGGQV